MIEKKAKGPCYSGQSVSLANLLLREAYHRCSNDLQLVVSLLSLQSRRASNPETRDVLAEVMARVGILARVPVQTDPSGILRAQGALQEV